MGLEATAGAAGRASAAALIDAWEASRGRAQKQADLEAEARALGVARTSLRGSLLSLRKAYTAARGSIPDRDCPGKADIDGRLEQLEEGSSGQTS